MRLPALVPQHVSLAAAAEIAKRHGFVLCTVRHEGRLRIAMVRPGEDGRPAGPDGHGGNSAVDRDRSE